MENKVEIDFRKIIEDIGKSKKEVISQIDSQIDEFDGDLSQLKEDKASKKKYYDRLVKKVVEIEAIHRNRIDSDEDIKKLMSYLCYGNLGYCCGLKKDCAWRNLVMAVLGVDRDKFVEMKEELGMKLAKMGLKEK